MAKNLKFYFDDAGTPCARGPQTEKLLMSFLETDIQGDDHICHDIMEDLHAIESEAAEEREFTGNAHSVSITSGGIKICCHAIEPAKGEAEELYETTLRHFREVIEDWEAFILGESDDLPDDDNLHV